MTDFDYPRLHTLLADMIAPKGVKDSWAYREINALMPNEETTRLGILELAKITAEATRLTHEDGTVCEEPLQLMFVDQLGNPVDAEPNTPGGVSANLVLAFSDNNETAAKALLDDVPSDPVFVQLVFISMMQGYVTYCVHKSEHLGGDPDIV